MRKIKNSEILLKFGRREKIRDTADGLPQEIIDFVQEHEILLTNIDINYRHNFFRPFESSDLSGFTEVEYNLRGQLFGDLKVDKLGALPQISHDKFFFVASSEIAQNSDGTTTVKLRIIV